MTHFEFNLLRLGFVAVNILGGTYLAFGPGIDQAPNSKKMPTIAKIGFAMLVIGLIAGKGFDW